MTQICIRCLALASFSCLIYGKNLMLSLCSYTHFFPTTLMTVVSCYLILWLYSCRHWVLQCAFAVIIISRSLIRSGINSYGLFEYSWVYIFFPCHLYLKVIQGHSGWLISEPFNHIITPQVITGDSVPIQSTWWTGPLCDKQTDRHNITILRSVVISFY